MSRKYYGPFINFSTMAIILICTCHKGLSENNFHFSTEVDMGDFDVYSTFLGFILLLGRLYTLNACTNQYNLNDQTGKLDIVALHCRLIPFVHLFISWCLL